jgi:hypothetical protein
MRHWIQRHRARIHVPGATSYTPVVLGEERPDGTWEGSIQFLPAEPATGRVLYTDRETTQPNRGALEYWASGLEPVYFEGAFARAVDRT